MKQWNTCKNILVIRADNMGDLIMTTPALRALKETFPCRITLLTSRLGGVIVPHISYIDEAIVYDVPWVKGDTAGNASTTTELVQLLRGKQFDAAIIFTVYSQSALPAAMLALQAGIPLRLAYCRENPYQLLTDWLPDDEPYRLIRHQVERDLRLVDFIGARTGNNRLEISYNRLIWPLVQQQLSERGISTGKRWVILHAGVSEEKRRYPEQQWVAIAQRLAVLGYTVLLTGSAADAGLAGRIATAAGHPLVHPVAGLLNIEAFVALVAEAPLVISVNTGTVHIAAAVQTPVLVLYAQTNPQHTPWRVPHVVLPFSVSKEAQSRNAVIQWVNSRLYREHIPYPDVKRVIREAVRLMSGGYTTGKSPFARQL
jgi:ADP-heptose:LPS heptosyltransferase